MSLTIVGLVTYLITVLALGLGTSYLPAWLDSTAKIFQILTGLAAVAIALVAYMTSSRTLSAKFAERVLDLDKQILSNPADFAEFKKEQSRSTLDYFTASPTSNSVDRQQALVVALEAQLEALRSSELENKVSQLGTLLSQINEAKSKLEALKSEIVARKQRVRAFAYYYLNTFDDIHSDRPRGPFGMSRSSWVAWERYMVKTLRSSVIKEVLLADSGLSKEELKKMNTNFPEQGEPHKWLRQKLVVDGIFSRDFMQYLVSKMDGPDGWGRAAPADEMYY